MRGIGEAMTIVWAELGLVIEDIVETQESLTIYISVPETSYELDANGEMMSGKFLRQRFKESMIDMGVKRLTVMGRNRKGEHWTKEMADQANLDIRKTIYGSQY